VTAIPPQDPKPTQALPNIPEKWPEPKVQAGTHDFGTEFDRLSAMQPSEQAAYAQMLLDVEAYGAAKAEEAKGFGENLLFQASAAAKTAGDGVLNIVHGTHKLMAGLGGAAASGMSGEGFGKGWDWGIQDVREQLRKQYGSEDPSILDAMTTLWNGGVPQSIDVFNPETGTVEPMSVGRAGDDLIQRRLGNMAALGQTVGMLASFATGPGAAIGNRVSAASRIVTGRLEEAIAKSLAKGAGLKGEQAATAFSQAVSKGDALTVLGQMPGWKQAATGYQKALRLGGRTFTESLDLTAANVVQSYAVAKDADREHGMIAAAATSWLASPLAKLGQKMGERILTSGVLRSPEQTKALAAIYGDLATGRMTVKAADDLLARVMPTTGRTLLANSLTASIEGTAFLALPQPQVSVNGEKMPDAWDLWKQWQAGDSGAGTALFSMWVGSVAGIAATKYAVPQHLAPMFKSLRPDLNTLKIHMEAEGYRRYEAESKKRDVEPGAFVASTPESRAKAAKVFGTKAKQERQLMDARAAGETIYEGKQPAPQQPAPQQPDDLAAKIEEVVSLHDWATPLTAAPLRAGWEPEFKNDGSVRMHFGRDAHAILEQNSGTPNLILNAKAMQALRDSGREPNYVAEGNPDALRIDPAETQKVLDDLAMVGQSRAMQGALVFERLGMEEVGPGVFHNPQTGAWHTVDLDGRMRTRLPQEGDWSAPQDLTVVGGFGEPDFATEALVGLKQGLSRKVALAPDPLVDNVIASAINMAEHGNTAGAKELRQFFSMIDPVELRSMLTEQRDNWLAHTLGSLATGNNNARNAAREVMADSAIDAQRESTRVKLMQAQKQERLDADQQKREAFVERLNAAELGAKEVGRAPMGSGVAETLRQYAPDLRTDWNTIHASIAKLANDEGPTGTGRLKQIKVAAKELRTIAEAWNEAMQKRRQEPFQESPESVLEESRIARVDDWLSKAGESLGMEPIGETAAGVAMDIPPDPLAGKGQEPPRMPQDPPSDGGGPETPPAPRSPSPEPQAQPVVPVESSGPKDGGQQTTYKIREGYSADPKKNAAVSMHLDDIFIVRDEIDALMSRGDTATADRYDAFLRDDMPGSNKAIEVHKLAEMIRKSARDAAMDSAPRGTSQRLSDMAKAEAISRQPDDGDTLVLKQAAERARESGDILAVDRLENMLATGKPEAIAAEARRLSEPGSVGSAGGNLKVTQAKAVKNGARKALEWAINDRLEVLERTAAAPWTKKFKEARSRQREMIGEAQVRFAPAERALRGMKASAMRVEVVDGTPMYRWQALAEGRIQPANDRERAAAAALRDAGLYLWDQARAAGVRRAEWDAASADYRWKPLTQRDQFVMPRMHGADWDTFMGPEANRRRLWDWLIEHNNLQTAEMLPNGMPRMDGGEVVLRPKTADDFEKAWTKPKGTGMSAEKEAAFEFVRQVKNFPAMFEGHQLLEANPFEAVRRLIYEQAGRTAAVEAWGQDLPASARAAIEKAEGITLRPGAESELMSYQQQYLNNAATKGESAAMQGNAKDLLVTLQGRNPMEMSPLFRALYPLNSLANSAMTWKSWIQDLAAPFVQGTAYAGFRRMTRAIANVARTRQEAMIAAERVGSLFRNTGVRDLMEADSPTQKLADAIGWLATKTERIKTAMFDRMAVEMLGDWQKGRSTGNDRDVLSEMLLFDADEQASLLSGRADSALQARFRHEFVKLTTGRRTRVEGSKAMATPNVQQAIRFGNWISGRMVEIQRLARGFGPDRTMAQRARAAGRLAVLTGGFAVSSPITLFISYMVADAFKGENGYHRLVRELSYAPAAVVGKSLLGQVAGGPIAQGMAAIANPDKAKQWAGLTTPTALAYGVAVKLNEAYQSFDATTLGDAMESVGHSLWLMTGGVAAEVGIVPNDAKNLVAYLQGVAIGQDPRQTSDDRMVRAFRRIEGIETVAGVRDKAPAFYEALGRIKAAIGNSKDWKEAMAASQDDIKIALGLAQEESLSAAIRGMQHLDTIPDDKRAKLIDYARDDEQVARIYEHDMVVRELAKAVGRMHGESPTELESDLESAQAQARLGAKDVWNRLVDRVVDDATFSLGEGQGMPSSVRSLAEAMAPFASDLPWLDAKAQRAFSRGGMSRATRARMLQTILSRRARERVKSDRRERARD